MKTGSMTGLLFSGIGIMAGVFYGVYPVFALLANHEISGHQAGLYSAIIATITGLSCAMMGVIYNRSNKSI